jgi:hypothetical protein
MVHPSLVVDDEALAPGVEFRVDKIRYTALTLT